jgi:hypothetical protein
LLPLAAMRGLKGLWEMVEVSDKEDVSRGPIKKARNQSHDLVGQSHAIDLSPPDSVGLKPINILLNYITNSSFSSTIYFASIYLILAFLIERR